MTRPATTSAGPPLARSARSTSPRPGGPSPASTPALPLTMFPVRLATRLHRPDPERPPTRAVGAHLPRPHPRRRSHPRTVEAGDRPSADAYWERLWRAADDQLRRDDAHRWAVVAARRAARRRGSYQRRHRLNPASAPKQPVPDGATAASTDRSCRSCSGAHGEPPDAGPAAARRVARHRSPWHRVRRRGRGRRRCGRDLAMAPNLADLSGRRRRSRSAARAGHLWWMVDFDDAVEAGMAAARSRGTHRRRTAVRYGGDRVRRPRRQHRCRRRARPICSMPIASRPRSRSSPQGTPTNNTDTVRAGFVGDACRSRGVSGAPDRGTGGRRQWPASRPRRQDGTDPEGVARPRRGRLVAGPDVRHRRRQPLRPSRALRVVHRVVVERHEPHRVAGDARDSSSAPPWRRDWSTPSPTTIAPGCQDGVATGCAAAVSCRRSASATSRMVCCRSLADPIASRSARTASTD